MNTSAATQYRTQQLMTASSAQRVAMLFDKAIGSLQEAIEAIGQGDIQGRWRANKRAMDIVASLASSLDMEQGGVIAAKLHDLYRFVLMRLVDVDIRNDPKPANEVIGLLSPLRESWHEIASSISTPLQPTSATDAALEPGSVRITA